MPIVGKLDKDKFKAISPNIKTDEVVLTDKQRIHIMERRAKTLERYESELKNIVENPDYIFADPKHKDTALVIKEYSNTVQVVLRLCTEEANKKNSIITMWEIKGTRFERYLSSHTPLYKRG
jgi:hypothetical protein